MKYLEWITQSKTYTVPKSGIYKIICVGGGASGAAFLSYGILSNAGQSTSFGGYLSADGGDICYNSASVSNSDYPACGQNGYDGLDYGSTSVKFIDATKPVGYNKYVEAGTGFGYGAGGGGYNVSIPIYTYGNNGSGNGSGNRGSLNCKGGRCGKMISTIVDLTEGEQIPCVVGKGGSNIFALADIELKLLGNSVNHLTGNSITTVPEALSKGITSGADGVIIVQYIGASM